MYLIKLLKVDVNKSQKAINQITNKFQNAMSKLHDYYLAIDSISDSKHEKTTMNHTSDFYVVLIFDHWLLFVI